MDEQWRAYDRLYDLSSRGRLRKKLDSRSRPGHILTPGGRHVFFYYIYSGTHRATIHVARMMQQVWPEIPFTPDSKWREWVSLENVKDGMPPSRSATPATPRKKGARPDKAVTGKNHLRKCAGGCGRKIVNYKCESCWQKDRDEYGEFYPAPVGYKIHLGLIVYGY